MMTIDFEYSKTGSALWRRSACFWRDRLCGAQSGYWEGGADVGITRSGFYGQAFQSRPVYCGAARCARRLIRLTGVRYRPCPLKCGFRWAGLAPTTEHTVVRRVSHPTHRVKKPSQPQICSAGRLRLMRPIVIGRANGSGNRQGVCARARRGERVWRRGSQPTRR